MEQSDSILLSNCYAGEIGFRPSWLADSHEFVYFIFVGAIFCMVVFKDISGGNTNVWQKSKFQRFKKMVQRKIIIDKLFCLSIIELSINLKTYLLKELALKLKLPLVFINTYVIVQTLLFNDIFFIFSGFGQSIKGEFCIIPTFSNPTR